MYGEYVSFSDGSSTYARKIAERYPGTATGDDISIVALSAGVSAFGGDPHRMGQLLRSATLERRWINIKALS